MRYTDFLERKTSIDNRTGFDVDENSLNGALFDFQKFLLIWALKKGRSAIFADCGLGKTLIELEWANQILQKTNKPVLILTPLAVSYQTIKEGEKFGIECVRSGDGQINEKTIYITNYERLHYFNPDDFSGVVCDESSILKSFNGARKNEIIRFMKKIPYRLLATATAAPNDYTELGTSSEALGELGLMDMLNRFFKNDQNNSGTGRVFGEVIKWRFKGHAEIPFWKWVTSWARACRKPSDFGFDDNDFILPELKENINEVDPEKPKDGFLFDMPAANFREQREERRRTIKERCEAVSKLVTGTGKPALVWCHLNDEGNMMQNLIKDSIQVSGSDNDEKKEEKLYNFAKGHIRVLITKPKIGAWGLNFQHCNHITYFPSHSYEQYYQAVRRCWRFGQKKPVKVDIVTTPGDWKVFQNMQRKRKLADKMFQSLIAEMNNSIKISGHVDYNKKEEVPSWL